MNIEFDFENVEFTEFGVGRKGGSYTSIPVDVSVQSALQGMARDTYTAMQDAVKEGFPHLYEPSDKYSAEEYVYLPLSTHYAEVFRAIHNVSTLPKGGNALGNLDAVTCYFTRMKDNKGTRLTALRRATQFKGLVRKKRLIVRLIDDTLHVFDDNVFQLDKDFDLLIDSKNIHILRPRSFEILGCVADAIKEGAFANVQRIKKDMPFVSFDSIEQYARTHVRAARYLASISQGRSKNIDKGKLLNSCKKAGVAVSESNGFLSVSKGHELNFLQLLDRRLYEVSLVRDKPERYRADSRKEI